MKKNLIKYGLILKLILPLILCLMALTGCDNREEYIGIEGTVVEKEFEPEHYITTYVYTGKVLIPIINRIPDTWTLTVEYETDGETEKIRYEVTEALFNEYGIGDKYIYYREVNND